jgi:hypothetical protein
MRERGQLCQNGVRIEYAGVYYHVMARGNRREAIFWTVMIGGFPLRFFILG